MSVATIVGAGPGDPDLITLKGIRAVEEADVILYDALVSPLLLRRASPQCKLVYTGKRKGKKEFAQEEINQLLVFYCQRFDKVVRLKGGDPHIFGRGHEELSYLSKHGIKAEVIPGISSALYAPFSAGIPLTKRGVNESFWVVTGTVSSGQLSGDFHLAAQSTASIVVLMGFSKLEEIAEIVSDIRSASEPMAVIQNASLPGEKIVIGTANTISSLVTEAQLASPAVIMIGKVILEREPAEWINPYKLMDAL